MNNETFYKVMYEAAKEDRKEANDKLCEYVLADLETKLGDFYWNFVDYIITTNLKETIKYLEGENDPYETPDNKSLDLSSAYRVLKWHMVDKDYKEFVKGGNNESS